MENVHTEIKGNKLVITVDISAPVLAKAQPSKSGKTRVVATTHGFTSVSLPPGLSFGLNVVTK